MYTYKYIHTNMCIYIYIYIRTYSSCPCLIIISTTCVSEIRKRAVTVCLKHVCVSFVTFKCNSESMANWPSSKVSWIQVQRITL